MIRTTATTASIIALACSATFAFASEVSRVPTPAQASSFETTPASDLRNPVNSVHGLKPRILAKKADPVSRLHAGFRDGSLKADAEQMNLPLTIVVKFRDDLKVRAGGSWMDGASVDPISGGLLASTSGGDIEAANAILSQLAGRVRQWINQPADVLAGLEARAVAASGAMQPDLAGMIEVRVGSASQLFSTARALNALDCVEFVSIDRKYANFQCGGESLNGDCANPTGPPNAANPAAGTDRSVYGCSDFDCCTAVVELDPFCDGDTAHGWDPLCAALANAICGGPSVYNVPPGTFDPCFASAADSSVVDPLYAPYYWTVQFNSCNLAHGNPGCNNSACCAAVCSFDPTCCESGWDNTCVVFSVSGAFPACEGPVATIEPSPDFTAREVPFPVTPDEPNGGLQGLQFYTQSQARAATVDPVYVSPGVEVRWPGVIDRTGFYGEQLGMSGNGYALKEFEAFQNFVWNTYQGGAGTENPNVRGGGVRIAVFESAAYTNHEEFLLSGPAKNPARPWDGPLLETARVIAEAGQTPLLIEDGNISAAHGTNTLGVIFAADNGFGITGMAPGAQGYFYPIISIEEGYRAQNAIVACLLEFEMGDVMNFSWGFWPDAQNGLPYTAGNFQPVTSDPALSTLMRLGTVLGVTTCAAAGGDPLVGQAIDGGDNLDQGAIIVGGSRAGNLVAFTIPGEILEEVEPGEYNPPSAAVCQSNLFDITLKTMRQPSSNFTNDPNIENQTVDSCGWGEYVVTTGSTTAQLGTIISNPTRAIFTGINEVPPSGPTPELQVDKLRTYTPDFGGTSAASAMMASVVANFQGAARQYFGTPLSPVQVRDMLRNGFNWQPCDNGGFGAFPNLTQLGPTMIGTPLVDGNETQIIVHTGLQLPGYAWNSFLIKAVDLNFLRLGVQRREAGTVVAGLTNMATGPTTDVEAKLDVSTVVDTSAQIDNLGVTVRGRATKNFVMMGVFVKNLDTHRYEFFGIDFLTTGDGDYPFDLPDLTNYSSYVDPTTHLLKMRVWTCGLGAVGRHQVWYDLIEIRVNQPFIPL